VYPRTKKIRVMHERSCHVVSDKRTGRLRTRASNMCDLFISTKEAIRQ
jgi:hypothetical protein